MVYSAFVNLGRESHTLPQSALLKTVAPDQLAAQLLHNHHQSDRANEVSA